MCDRFRLSGVRTCTGVVLPTHEHQGVRDLILLTDLVPDTT